MAQNKTQPTPANVDEFLAAVADPERRADLVAVAEIMRAATGEPPVMWGPRMVGFGRYRYRYASGREGEFFLTGFAPRKQGLTLYIFGGFHAFADLTARLGKHTASTGQSCLYVDRLADLDAAVLTQLVEASVAHMRAAHPVA